MPLSAPDGLVQIERHIGRVTAEGEAETRGKGAVIVIRLCLPCAWRNLHKIEKAIYEVVREANRE